MLAHMRLSPWRDSPGRAFSGTARPGGIDAAWDSIWLAAPAFLVTVSYSMSLVGFEPDPLRVLVGDDSGLGSRVLMVAWPWASALLLVVAWRRLRRSRRPDLVRFLRLYLLMVTVPTALYVFTSGIAFFLVPPL